MNNGLEEMKTSEHVLRSLRDGDPQMTKAAGRS